MGSIPLRDALLEDKVLKDIASRVSELATKADTANLETRLIKWMVGYGGGIGWLGYCRQQANLKPAEDSFDYPLVLGA